MLTNEKFPALLHDSEDTVHLTVKAHATEIEHKNKSRRLSILAPASISLELQSHRQRFKSKKLTEVLDNYRKTKAVANLLQEKGDEKLVELIHKWRNAFLLALPELTEICKDVRTGYPEQDALNEEIVGSDATSSQYSQEQNKNNNDICRMMGVAFETIDFDFETNEFKELD